MIRDVRRRQTQWTWPQAFRMSVDATLHVVMEADGRTMRPYEVINRAFIFSYDFRIN